MMPAEEAINEPARTRYHTNRLNKSNPKVRFMNQKTPFFRKLSTAGGTR
jgi:hypothetical protein